MAEIATGVLHNVGNVLNSVNTSAVAAREEISQPQIRPTWAKPPPWIQEHRPDIGQFLTADPQGKQLPEYLSGLATVLAEEQKSACTRAR